MLSVTAAAPAAAQTRTLVVSTYGLNGDLLKKHVYDPFKARCGCELVIETGNVAERMAKLEARRANPTVDLIQLPDFTALEASGQALLENLDYAKLKNATDIYHFGSNPIRHDDDVAYQMSSRGPSGPEKRE